MAHFETRIDVHSPKFAANKAHFEKLLAVLRERFNTSEVAASSRGTSLAECHELDLNRQPMSACEVLRVNPTW